MIHQNWLQIKQIKITIHCLISMNFCAAPIVANDHSSIKVYFIVCFSISKFFITNIDFGDNYIISIWWTVIYELFWLHCNFWVNYGCNTNRTFTNYCKQFVRKWLVFPLQQIDSNKSNKKKYYRSIMVDLQRVIHSLCVQSLFDSKKKKELWIYWTSITVYKWFDIIEDIWWQY